MGRNGGSERASLTKALANRANAAKPRLSKRRGSDDSQQQLAECVELLRAGAPLAVALLQQIMGDKLFIHRNGQRQRVRISTSLRLRAAAELLDRAGVARRLAHGIDLAIAPPKLFEIRHFPPPPSWNPDPPLQQPETVVVD